MATSATLVREEEARNAALAQSDLLRHQLNSTVEEFEKLTGGNVKAALELPQGVKLPKEVSNR